MGAAEIKKFWTCKHSERHEGDEIIRTLTRIEIDTIHLYQLLFDAGFRRYDIDDDSIFIRITNQSIITKVTPTKIQDFIFDYIDNQVPEFIDKYKIATRHDLKRKLIDRINHFIDPKKMYIMKHPDPIIFNRDTRDKKYIYYRNGFVLVTPAGTSFNQYSQLDNFIWESEILDRDFKKVDWRDSEVDQFYKLISGQLNESGDHIDLPERYNSLKQITGYYLHDFVDRKLKLLLLTDSEISDDDEANGRTGKTLFCKILGYMVSRDPNDKSIRTYCEVNGKDFDPKERTKYTGADLDTKLIILNDLRKNFDLECLYNDITEGVLVKKLFMQPFLIRVKMIASTNKTVRVSGSSSRDRIIEFEFSNYFTDRWTPEMKFGKWLFRDWGVFDWHKFDSFMIHCLEIYFKADCRLPVVKEINLAARKLQDNTHPNFVDWLDNFGIKFDEEYSKAELFNLFKEEFPDFKNDKFKQATFTKWLKYYCLYKPEFSEYATKANQSPDIYSHEVRTNKQRMIIFRKAQ